MQIKGKLMNQTWENGKKKKKKKKSDPVLARLAQDQTPKWKKKLVSRFFFSSKIWLRQSLDIMVSYHHVKYLKKLTIQSWENLVTDEQTEGR